MTSQQPLESWAIVELMGHRTRPGYVKEVEIAGGKMLRIDIPVSETQSVTEFYGIPAIYSIRPATEEVVRDNVGYASRDPRPIRPVDYRPRPAIAVEEETDTEGEAYVD